jgi:anti-sigma factor RsiW
MTETFQCGDSPALVGYMYGECEPAERRAIDQHLLVCPACAAELEALGATRIQLAAWTPPEAQLGFRMVSDRRPSNVVRPSRWWAQPIPAWAQVAAAAVIFAAGLSLGVWRGTASPGASPAAPAAAVATASPTAPTAVASVSDLAALEQRLRSEMALMRTSTAAPLGASQAASPSEAQILARVRTLIDESEQRQQRELALRTAQVVRDFDSQRRVDLNNVRSIVGQVEGTTGAEIARQQQTLQYLMRVSQDK